VIKQKKEFQDLNQGSMSVIEHITKFTQLSRYAPHEVDTDEKKQKVLLNDLNDGGMVNKALMLENCKGMIECKRKQVRQHQPSNSSRP
jgi:hypothetical protein